MCGKCVALHGRSLGCYDILYACPCKFKWEKPDNEYTDFIFKFDFRSIALIYLMVAGPVVVAPFLVMKVCLTLLRRN
jgi:hypothetical protein